MIINEAVEVRVWTNNIQHFRELGYECQLGETIEVKQTELKDDSNLEVTRECDCCHKLFTKPYRNMRMTHEVYGKDVCIECSKHNLDIVATKIAKQKATYKERTGYEFSFQNPEAREKGVQTMLDRFGVDNPMHSEIIKAVQKQIIFERYGVENVSQNEEIKAKKVATTQEHFGVDYPSQCKEVRDKQIQTCLERFGVEYPSQCEEVRDKQKQTMLEHYGVEYPLQNPVIKQKTQETCNERYGGPSPACSLEVREKISNTLAENGIVKTSSQQIACYELLKSADYQVELNAPIKGFNLDVLVNYKDYLIDVEYDCNYWHQDKQKDRRRDEVLKKEGYKIIRISADREIPTLEQLQQAIDKIVLNGYNFVSIKLDK